MKSLQNKGVALDGVDEKLIAALIKNARSSMRDLAALVGMSAPSVTERVRRLEDIGVIRGFTLDLDPQALGYALQAIVRIKPLPGQLKKVETLIQTIPECMECDKVTGEDCFIARFCVPEIGSLDGLLEGLEARAETNTAIIKTSPVPRRLPPLQAGRS
ncbi:Lrp/AsnC family transcriptional regulator [Pelagibius litoralis]|uniref:Lrp/AsnC family transcriptional regulator n=1 Tax=Pelagibius litoralis TaxID=374515 RepID=UPI002AC36CFA|nr:Lrp/AsnC family transcriptional regulator [Pelagibius litoralis]